MSRTPDLVTMEIPVGDAGAIEEFNRLYTEWMDEFSAHLRELATELGVSQYEAGQIFYLRERSRHTDELEARCLRAMKAGHELPILSGEEEAELLRLGF